VRRPRPPRARIAFVLTVLDLNDHPPEFEQPNQTIIFKETFPVGHEITRSKVGISPSSITLPDCELYAKCRF
jgi:hypothetical protein